MPGKSGLNQFKPSYFHMSEKYVLSEKNRTLELTFERHRIDINVTEIDIYEWKTLRKAGDCLAFFNPAIMKLI